MLTIALVVLLVSVQSVRALNQEHQAFSRFVQLTSTRVALAQAVQQAAQARAIGVRNLMLVESREDLDAEGEAVAAAHQQVTERVARLEAAVRRDGDVSAQERERFTHLAKLESDYAPVALDILGLAAAGERADALRRMNAECRPLLTALVQATDAYIAAATAAASEQMQASDDAFVANRTLMLAASATAIGAAVVLAIVLTHSIVRPVRQAGAVAQAVAAGDLRVQVPTTGAGELAELLASLRAMSEGLCRIVHSVRGASDSMAVGSQQIASGNADLSARTERQAARLQQAAASMEEMNSAIGHSEDAARQAARRAAAARDAAERGGELVGEMVVTMDRITDRSRRIGDIIGVIDGIAFQTNILALNAAVEAARAGEQGRGFAVVAGEVRSLAQRSGEAAREIKTLIGDSVHAVGEGARLVGDTRSAMEIIVGQVRHVSDLMAALEASTAQHAARIGEVNQVVSELDQATQQNAALVEQSAAAADSLRQQSQRLAQAVATFRLPDADLWSSPDPRMA